MYCTLTWGVCAAGRRLRRARGRRRGRRRFGSEGRRGVRVRWASSRRHGTSASCASAAAAAGSHSQPRACGAMHMPHPRRARRCSRRPHWSRALGDERSALRGARGSQLENSRATLSGSVASDGGGSSSGCGPASRPRPRPRPRILKAARLPASPCDRLDDQLKMVAGDPSRRRTLSAGAAFYVNIGGFDSHSDEGVWTAWALERLAI